MECNRFLMTVQETIYNFPPFYVQQATPKSLLQNSSTRKMRHERMSTFYQLQKQKLKKISRELLMLRIVEN